MDKCLCAIFIQWNVKTIHILLENVNCNTFIFIRGWNVLFQEEGKAGFLRTLRELPYGEATFFNMKRQDDPIGLLPGRVLVGINRCGIHFFRPMPKASSGIMSRIWIFITQ